MKRPFHITGPAPGDGDVCNRLLRGLPDWFGLEDAIVEYNRDVTTLPTFLAEDAGGPIGLLSVRRHFPESAEVHVMAVAAPWHRRGVGTAMLDAAERWLASEGCRYLQVKTLSASRECSFYARTRAFYVAQGFRPLEEFPTLWSPANPCLQLVKSL